ncbi:hypothetical protein [Streptomyces sp. DH12]|uniref:hypothetical protein n=1 Tax=Streptomyces sp. DH12 TaxID=2857010 RepID=UPI001E5E0015|nr:hypothetical protein [Streptomyces sp. DH12]
MVSDPVIVVTAAAVCAAAVAAAATRLVIPALQARRATTPPALPGPDVITALHADGQVDALDYAICPDQGRRTPHAVRADESRRCWVCGCETPGATR